MKKVLIYHKFEKEDINFLKNKFKDFNFVVCTEEAEMEEQIADTDILITFKLDKNMLKKAKQLRFVQGLSAGIETFPLADINKKGIVLSNGRGIHKIHMAEYAICMMVILARSIHIMFQNGFKGIWDRSIPQEEINNATVGILGLGSIGLEIAKRANFMGMKVIGVKGNLIDSKYVDEIYLPHDMAKVFEESDYIINLLPSVKETYKLIDKKYFDLMKKDACFINMGRGSTINEEDIIEALKKKRIRAFASDVFFVEPLPADSPLWKMDNVVITPHMCGESSKYIKRSLPIIENNINAYKGKGNYINLVNFEKGY